MSFLMSGGVNFVIVEGKCCPIGCVMLHLWQCATKTPRTEYLGAPLRARCDFLCRLAFLFVAFRGVVAIVVMVVAVTEACDGSSVCDDMHQKIVSMLVSCVEPV